MFIYYALVDKGFWNDSWNLGDGVVGYFSLCLMFNVIIDLRT